MSNQRSESKLFVMQRFKPSQLVLLLRYRELIRIIGEFQAECRTDGQPELVDHMCGVTNLVEPLFTRRPHFGVLVRSAITVASLLHDNGKITVKNHGRTFSTEAERKKNTLAHTIAGAKRLHRKIMALAEGEERQCARLARIFVINHHTPERIKDRTLRECGYCLHAADIWLALVTKRSYKPAFSLERARHEILKIYSEDRFAADADLWQPILTDLFKHLEIAPPDFSGRSRPVPLLAMSAAAAGCSGI